MANIFTIKHGQGVPDEKLNPYELGYSDDGEKLYIGGPLKDKVDENGNPIKVLGDAIPVSGNIEIIENSAGGQFVYYNDSKLQVNNLLILGKENFGSTLPTENLIEGRIFVLLEEE